MANCNELPSQQVLIPLVLYVRTLLSSTSLRTMFVYNTQPAPRPMLALSLQYTYLHFDHGIIPPAYLAESYSLNFHCRSKRKWVAACIYTIIIDVWGIQQADYLAHVFLSPEWCLCTHSSLQTGISNTIYLLLVSSSQTATFSDFTLRFQERTEFWIKMAVTIYAHEANLLQLQLEVCGTDIFKFKGYGSISCTCMHMATGLYSGICYVCIYCNTIMHAYTGISVHASAPCSWMHPTGHVPHLVAETTQQIKHIIIYIHNQL